MQSDDEIVLVNAKTDKNKFVGFKLTIVGESPKEEAAVDVTPLCTFEYQPDNCSETAHFRFSIVHRTNVLAPSKVNRKRTASFSEADDVKRLKEAEPDNANEE